MTKKQITQSTITIIEYFIHRQVDEKTKNRQKSLAKCVLGEGQQLKHRIMN